MNSSGTFWALVRHEFRMKGSWRKRNRSPIAKWWWVVYFSLIVIIGFSTATYYAVHKTLHLESLWFATLGLPYMLFFIGHSTLKREWENETHGWWLTLPYPRLWLIGAKWIAALLQMMVIVIGICVLGLLYATGIALALSHYTFADVGSFMLEGFNWLVLVFGFSPFILALGLLTTTTQYTLFRPVSPILWVVCMASGGVFYSRLGALFPHNNVFQELSGDHPVTFFPFSWEMPTAMAVSWLVAYLMIHLSAILLDKKISV